MYETYFDSVPTFTSVELWCLSLIVVSVLIGKPFFRQLYHKVFGVTPKISFGVAFVFILLFLGLRTYDATRSFLVMKQITSGNFLVAEGAIENFKFSEARSRDESFNINDVKFEYNSHATKKIFYANPKSSKSPIKDGIMARVSYIEYGGKNHIFKLELKPDDK